MAEFPHLIQKYLLRLTALVDRNENETSKFNETAAVDLIKSINEAFHNYSVKESLKASVCSHVFHETYGITTLLRSIVTVKKELKDLKKSCFQFMNDFVALVGDKTISYGPEIKDLCIMYVKRETIAEVNKAAVITLSKVLELCHTMSETGKMGIKELIQDLFMQLVIGSKVRSTVKECVLCLLGTIARYYPSYFIECSDRMLGVYLREMKIQMTCETKRADQSIISGCLLGLKEYLYNFTVSDSEAEDKSRQIYDCVKSAINAKTRNSNICKAGLQLLEAHSSQFGMFLYDSYGMMYESLWRCMTQDSREVGKLGFLAIISFLKQIAELLPEKIQENRSAAKNVYNFFMDDFKDIFRDTKSTREWNVAAVGYSLFAASCKLLEGEANVKKMMYNLMQRSEHLFFGERGNFDDNIIILPAFLEALASTISEIEHIPETYLFLLEKLVVFQIDKFPRVPTTHQFLAAPAVVKVLLVLQTKPDIFQGFLSRIVYQGLVRTCSHALAVEVETKTDGQSVEFIVENPRAKIFTYKHFLNFWSSILNLVQWKELNALCIPLSQRQSLRESIYDEILRNVIALYHKLDLSTNNPTDLNDPAALEELSVESSSDPVHGIQASNLQDCRIFINLVDFSKDLLLNNAVDLFEKWVYMFGKETICYSTRYPFISGFYKLVALNLNICSKINYFKNLSSTDVDSSDIMQVDNDREHHSAIHLFTKFGKEVTVRLQQFKDDLLASCLLLLLALPTEIIENEIHILVSVLQNTFKIGLTYLPLASVSLDSLERWHRELPDEVIERYYPEILPLLNQYLIASGLEGDTTSERVVKPSAASLRRGHQLSAKFVKTYSRNGPSNEILDDSELSKIQMKIIHFLGNLGGKHNRAMLENAFDKAKSASVAWDFNHNQHLKYAVPFVDMKPEIYFDDFLPRVLELATTSSDRHIKVAACEVLHSLVLYIVGCGSRMPETQSQKMSMEQLYKHFFPGLLELACNADQVVKQLFQPLVLQLTHWFTHKKTIATLESQIILASLWDGVTHHENAALRDFCALCLKEYFLWTIKQSGKDNNKIYVKNMFNKMCSFALHPSSHKRMGAALVFNNLYSIFRNEDSLITEFTVELLVRFVESLAIAHCDDKLLGTQKLCSEALDHIKRILEVKAMHFVTPVKNARKPICLDKINMESVVEWLFRQCGNPQTECRHKCMELVKAFAPLVPGVNSISAFMANFLRGENVYNIVFEHRLIELGVPPQLSLTFSYQTPITWLEALTATLECYNWAVVENMLDQDFETLLASVKVFAALEFFIKDIILSNLYVVSCLFEEHSREHVEFSPRELNEFNWAKCTTLIRLYNLFVTLCNRKNDPVCKEFADYLWEKDFWEVILLSILDPSILGFDTSDSNTVANLYKEMDCILKTCYCHQIDFKEFCKEYLSTNKKYNAVHCFPINFRAGDIDHMKLCQLFSGCELLVDNGLLFDGPENALERDHIVEKLLDNIWSDFVETDESSYLRHGTSPADINLANHMLSFCDSLGTKAETLITKFLICASLDRSSSNSNKGIVIFAYFENKLTEMICKVAEAFISQLLTECFQTDQSTAISIIVKFLSKVATVRELRKKYGTTILNSLLRCWIELSLCWNNSRDENALDTAVSILSNMTLIDSEVAINASKKYASSLFQTYVNLLRRPNTSLEFKVHTLDLLPFFLNLTDSDDINSLKYSLDMLVVNHFPTDSKELIVGSFQYNTYVSAIKKLLLALELTGCSMILEFVCKLICKEEKHIMHEAFLHSLDLLPKNHPANKHQTIVEAAFNLIKPGTSSQSPNVQLAIMDVVCLTLLKTIALSAFTNFYVSHIKSIMENLKQTKLYNVDSRKVQYVAKINSMKLMEVLYQRLNKDQLHTVESQVVFSYVGGRPGKGNELTTDITKFCLEFKKDSKEIEASLVEFSRFLCCASFNTLISVVSCVQTDIKFYNVFIFKENALKGEKIWELLIDTEKQYKFDLELEEAMTRKKQFVTIRHKVRNSNDGETSFSGGSQSSMHMMASQHLAMSSLADDASKFDFSTAGQLYVSRKKEAEENHVEVPEERDMALVEIEADDLNLHECMTPVTSLLRHMHATQLIPKEFDKSPSWLESIVNNFQDPNVHKNAKLFLARVVINNAQVLSAYGKLLLKPLMNLIASGTLGKALDYCILDIIVAMLSWAPEVIPEDNLIHKHDATCVLEFLIRRCGHSRREIFRNNLEVIKTLLECWKGRYDIQYSAIYDQMRHHDSSNNKDSVVGIQLLGVVLMNGLPPYPDGCESEGQARLNVLLSNLNNKYKEVYASASEVIGLILKYKKEKNVVLDEDPFYVKLIEILRPMRNEETDKFLVCLHIMNQAHPSLSSRFMSKLLFMQPKVHGIYQRYVLELLCSCIADVEDGYTQLKAIQIFQQIEHKEETIQHILLQAIEKVSKSLPCDEIIQLMPSFISIQSQPYVQCRLVLYKIMMSLYDEHKGSDGAKEKEITRLSQEVLLKALADNDSSLRLTVDNFWSSEERLPVGTMKRLIALMENMYSPSTEESFLQYATYLLLERTSHSPDYKRKIFEYPLSDCNFAAYSIATSWRQRYAAMTPLFVDTLSTSMSSSLESVDLSSFGDNAEHVIRATQPQMGDFSATLDLSHRDSTFNWLTDRSVDTFQEWGGQDASFSGTFSSRLLAARKGKSSPRKATDKQAENQGKKDRSAIWFLKRRFIKDKSTTSETFARQEMHRRDLRREMQVERKRRREAEVTMYRQYRIGDLPDIEILNSAVIAPLQALAQSDACIAKVLLKSLVLAICKIVKTEDQLSWDEYIKNIAMHLNSILKNSTNYVPTVISFCLELLHNMESIDTDPEDVFVSSLKSNQQSIGILLLESNILKSIEKAEPPRKRKRQIRPPIPESTNRWVKLAGLYKSVNDIDACNGIFYHIMELEEEESSQFNMNKQALELEARGQFADAVTLYEKLYDNANEESHQAEKDFWDNSVLYCYDQLTQWQELELNSVSRFTDINNPDLQSVWDDPYYINNYLPFMLRSKLKRLLDDIEDQSLLTFVDVSIKDDERKSYIEAHYVEELALLYIIQENFDAARHYSLKCLSNFLKEWKSLSSLAVGMQQSKLQDLQKFVELYEFLDVLKQSTSDNFCPIEKLMNVWQKRQPSILDPPNIWDDVVSNRQLYWKKLKVKCVTTDTDSPAQASGELIENDSRVNGNRDVTKTFSEHSVLLKLAFAKQLTLQGNVPAALQHLKSIHKDVKKLDNTYWSKFIQAYCFANFHKAKKLSGEEKIELLLNSLSQISKIEGKSALPMQQKILRSKALEEISEEFCKSGVSFTELKDINQNKIIEIVHSNVIQEVGKNLHLSSFRCLRDAVLECQHKEQREESKSQAYMSLALFCNKYLRQKEDNDDSVPNTSLEYPKVLVESLLCALKYENSEALQFFPRLLQIIELYPDVIPIFIQETASIPCWKFLGWVNQMLVLLDKPEAEAVHKIVENIVYQYPDAIIYSFRLSCESFKFSDDFIGKKNKDFVNRIKGILEKNRAVSDFILAINHLSVPHVLFKDYMQNILILMRSRDQNRNKIVQLFSEMWEELFDKKSRDSLRVGPVQKHFSGKFGKSVKETCGKNGEKLLTQDIRPIHEWFYKMCKEMAALEKQWDNKNLKCFSPWLSEFRPWTYDQQIELPGQYSGKQKPLPEYHIKIGGFDQKVLVLKSITLPRRITIRGNDDKEYKILVKAGEDLRQDARIQQLFSVMNDIYHKDIECGRRHLNLTTYKVIPLSSRIGLIEWLDDTMVLREFMDSSMTERRTGSDVCNTISDWIGVDVKANAIHGYKTLHKKKKREESVRKFEEFVKTVPHGLLKQSFLKLSSSPEAFVSLRSQFAMSHAVLCISHWVLGIGDRHLGNSLIDMASGKAIGIDFGHAFGSAIQFLAIPELVPFRLTPQMLHLMEPLKEKGPYEATMIHTLSALTKNYDLLMNIMDIFIKEPTLNWKANAVKQQEAVGMTDEEMEEDTEWYPKQRVQIALSKLQGENPCHIMRKELVLGASDILPQLESLCMGDPTENVRARMGPSNLSVEQQVACLIDQATDPHILCKTYYGWNPWM